MNDDLRELTAEELRGTCRPDAFDFKTTADITPLDAVIGQKRAVSAIRFGLEMQSPGYNIFVTGADGTGKTTIVADIVKKHAAGQPAPDDWLMVNNFKDPLRPGAMAAPRGTGVAFGRAMETLTMDIRRELKAAFDNEHYREKRTETKKRYGEKQRVLFEELESLARSKNVKLTRGSTGFRPLPMIDDTVLTMEAFQALPLDRQARIEENLQWIMSEVEHTVRESGVLDRNLREELEELERGVTRFIVRHRIDIFRQDHLDSSAVIAYLDEVQADIVENVEAFMQSAGGGEKTSARPEQASVVNPYRVNILVDHRFTEGAPVVFEPNPTYRNVFGCIEKQNLMGGGAGDYTTVQAGSLLKANGGYLIMEIEPVLKNSQVWDALKRSMQTRQLLIEDMPIGLGFGVSALRPEPIPLMVKVILIGGYDVFQRLQNYDSKFNKVFRVRADFDDEVDRNEETIGLYARFIAKTCREEDLRPFTPGAVAAMVEFGAKSAADRNKLSTRFGPIVSVIKEADYWARMDSAGETAERHVIRALREYRFRYNLHEEKMQARIVDGSVLIDVSGMEIGQANALAVYQVGDISFGRPARITAETYMGKPGIVSIEREARLSGRIHDKGVMTLAGYLGRTFAQRFPLSLTISIAFEQSYAGIDGDSASSTELLAILSSLAEAPVRQGIAVTGSVNQKGLIQSIGGVNQKIEGFFDVCESRGLTGDQGVIIPRANVRNLMVKREVVEAVRSGRFHIYPVAAIQEGIEILTGLAAGRPGADGRYPKNTVFGRAFSKLEAFARKAQELKQAAELR